MALWNDKRTPQGVVTDSHSGASRPLQHISAALGAKYGVPAAPKPTPAADAHRPAAPVQNRQAKPRTAAPGKVPVDKPSNAAAVKGAQPSKAAMKAASTMTRLAKS